MLIYHRFLFIDLPDGLGLSLFTIFTSVSSVASESGTNLIVLGSFCGLHDGADGFRFLLPTGTIGSGRLNLQTEILNEQGAVEQLQNSSKKQESISVECQVPACP